MDSIRDKYTEFGVDEFYRTHASSYANPHESIIHEHLKLLVSSKDRSDSILDLCCGTGEVTRFLHNNKFTDVVGCDPHTHNEYVDQTGNTCLTHSFAEIAANGFGREYNTIICSFALHLCPESLLPQVLYQLSVSCSNLIVITPNKKPTISLYFEFNNEIIYERVRSRVYTSQFAS